jgi:hypothetical protein
VTTTRIVTKPREPKDHARVLRMAKEEKLRVVVLTRIKDTPSVEGKVERVATTDAFAVVGGIEVPMDHVIRVTVKRPRKALPR